MTRLLANAGILDSCSSSLGKRVEELNELGGELAACAQGIHENQALEVLDYDDKVDAARRALLAYADDLKELAEAMGHAAVWYHDAEMLTLDALLFKSDGSGNTGKIKVQEAQHHYSDSYTLEFNGEYVGFTWRVSSPLSPFGEYLGAWFYATWNGEEFDSDSWDTPWVGFLSLIDGDAGAGGEGKYGTKGSLGGTFADNQLEIRLGTEQNNIYFGTGAEIGNAQVSGGAFVDTEKSSGTLNGNLSYSPMNFTFRGGKTTDGIRTGGKVSVAPKGKGGKKLDKGTGWQADVDSEKGKTTIGGSTFDQLPIDFAIEVWDMEKVNSHTGRLVI